MSRDHDSPFGLSREELKGFLQLLIGSKEGLPKASKEIIAYLERVASREEVDAHEAAELARIASRTLLAEQLAAAATNPVRALGMHLRAKRVRAKYSTAQVALALGEELPSYERLENGRISPLDLPSLLLVRIVRLFGLSLSELRDAVRLALQRPQIARGLGFARAKQSEFTQDEQTIAAEDLVNVARPAKEQLEAAVLARIDEKLKEVNDLLSAHTTDPR